MPVPILLIDDDARLHQLLSSYLEQNGYQLSYACDGATGLAALARGHHEAVLLDGMMPGLDGLEVLRRIRATSSIPVIMLTARGDEADRVVGLELGADDYVAKPFSPRELLARLRAVMRRAHPEVEREELTVGDLSANLGTREVNVGGMPIDLTGLEFDLLVAMMQRAGRVVPRATMLTLAGRDDVTVNERAVDVHISKLRKKLGDDPRAPTRIRTVRGVGYTLSRGHE
jgi:DNA-binding response OmpR family regulator